MNLQQIELDNEANDDGYRSESTDLNTPRNSAETIEMPSYRILI